MYSLPVPFCSFLMRMIAEATIKLLLNSFVECMESYTPLLELVHLHFLVLSDLEQAMSDSSDAGIYRSGGSKAMHMKRACRGMQRCDFMEGNRGGGKRGGGNDQGNDDDLEEDEEVTPPKCDVRVCPPRGKLRSLISAPYICEPESDPA